MWKTVRRIKKKVRVGGVGDKYELWVPHRFRWCMIEWYLPKKMKFRNEFSLENADILKCSFTEICYTAVYCRHSAVLQFTALLLCTVFGTPMVIQTLQILQKYEGTTPTLRKQATPLQFTTRKVKHRTVLHRRVVGTPHGTSNSGYTSKVWRYFKHKKFVSAL